MRLTRSTALWLAILTVLLPGHAFGDTKITTARTSTGFTIILSGNVGGDERVAQAIVASTAASLCGELVPEFGKFRLDAQIIAAPGTALKPGRFEQEIRCVAPPTPTLTAITGPFEPSPDDEAEARRQALAFLALRDSGDAAGSYAMLEAGLKAQTTPEDWAKVVTAQPKELGSKPERTIAKVTWYVDPPGTDPGVYAAADFGGRSKRMAILCGYVALKRLAPRSYEVVRIEEGKLKASDASGMTAEKIAEMRVALRCRD